MSKTYNSGYSPVVTHPSTNPPISCLTRAERTGSRGLKILWSYVEEVAEKIVSIVGFGVSDVRMEDGKQ